MKPRIVGALLYLGLDVVVSFLFYRSFWAVLCLLPGMPLFCREWNRAAQRAQRQELAGEFLTALQLVNVSLQAGYAPENAFPDALLEMEHMFPPSARIVKEFARIKNGLELNRPLEELLMNFGQESQVESIQSFAEVFCSARRTGGNLSEIVQHTIQALQRREEVSRELQAVMAGKRMEQRMMGVIPLVILCYVSVTSPGFLDVMYHNLPGILIMSICLAVYASAYLWSVRIMQISVG